LDYPKKSGSLRRVGFYEVLVSLQKLSETGPDQSNLIDLLIYFAVSPTDPYKVDGYNHFLSEAMSKLDTYHCKITTSLEKPIVQSIFPPVVLSSLSPNAIPFCPRAEVSQTKEVVIDCLSKGSSVHGYGCDADLEASLEVAYLELNLILGASTATSLDKHLNRKLSDRYLDFTNNVKGAREKFQTAILNIQVYLAKRGDSMDPLASPNASKSSISNFVSETSYACPTKMGEGRDGPSHCPLPKVVVRSEEESQLSMNQEKLMSSTNNHNKCNNKKEDVLESTPKVRNDHCSGTSDGPVSCQKRSCDAEAEACLKEKYKELTDALVRLQTNSESSSPNELTRTLLVTGMSE